MVKLIFEGHSDDIFGETNHFNYDYDNCATGKPIEWLVQSGNEAIVVTGQHCPNNSGTWMIGVANYDPDYSDKDFPRWVMKIEAQDYRNGYQPRLIIECPDDVQIKCFQNMELSHD